MPKNKPCKVTNLDDVMKASSAEDQEVKEQVGDAQDQEEGEETKRDPQARLPDVVEEAAAAVEAIVDEPIYAVPDEIMVGFWTHEMRDGGFPILGSQF